MPKNFLQILLERLNGLLCLKPKQRKVTLIILSLNEFLIFTQEYIYDSPEDIFSDVITKKNVTKGT